MDSDVMTMAFFLFLVFAVSAASHVLYVKGHAYEWLREAHHQQIEHSAVPQKKPESHTDH